MKRVIALITICGLFLVSNVLTSVASAGVSTTETEFLDQNPVVITGFMWGSETSPNSGEAFRVLRYIQLYNNSSKPIDLSAWSVAVQPFNTSTGMPVCEVQDCPHVTLPSAYDGLLAPGKHIVIDDGDTVNRAFKGLPLIETEEFVKSKLSVQLRLSSAGFQESIVQVKPDFTPTSADYYWQRNLGATGSSYVSGFSVDTVLSQALFNDRLYLAPTEAPFSVVEIYPYSLSCSPAQTEYSCGDYIKLHVDKNVDLAAYVVRTDSSSESRTAANTLYLAENVVKNGYITIMRDSSGKRLNLTNSGGHVWLEDIYGQKLYSETMVNYPAATGGKQGYSWARTDSNQWQWSTSLSPEGPNTITPIIEELKVCPDGKYLNPDTGRCRTIEEAVNALAACPEGQERNPLTNRCRSKASATSTLKPCGEGQERNPLTNRCRSIASAVAELLPCDEGYERNPLTNRCRKVVSASALPGSLKDTKSITETPGVWSGWTWALVAVGATGAIGYGVYEWRTELRDVARKFVAKLGNK